MEEEILQEIELWHGIKHKISTCCVIFFESAWSTSIKKQIPEYSQTMSKLTNNQGVIMCPDCLINKMTNEN